ncbi:MAG TPA: threonine/serine exporter family protein [Tissierellaceae bacterium]
MDIIFQLILGFFATLGFSILFNVPKKSIFPSGLVGAIGWMVSYIFTIYFDQKVFGTFIASFVIGMLGEIFAIKLKKPATVFIIPGITPLVPGAGTYYTMLYLIQKDYQTAIRSGAETLFVAAAIAIGVIFASVFMEYSKSLKRKLTD